MISMRKKVVTAGIIAVLGLGIMGCGALSATAPEAGQKNPVKTVQAQGKKPLVVYFTYSENIDTTGMSADAITSASMHGVNKNKEGNMQVMVQEIQKRTGADVYPIVVKDLYAPKFEDMTQKAKADIQQKKVTPLKNPLPDLSQYDVVYFGTPVWWYTLPAPVSTFLKQANLAGKTIVPFGIHRGSGFSSNLDTIQEMQPKAKLTEGFTIDAGTPNQEVRQKFDGFLDKLLEK